VPTDFLRVAGRRPAHHSGVAVEEGGDRRRGGSGWGRWRGGGAAEGAGGAEGVGCGCSRGEMDVRDIGIFRGLASSVGGRGVVVRGLQRLVSE
jgi:hypothetical protein